MDTIHPHETDVLLFGTMGTIGTGVQASLRRHGLCVTETEFPQNVFHDEPGYRRTLVRAIADCRPAFVFPVGHPLAMSRFAGLPGQTHGETGNPYGRGLRPEREESYGNVRFAVESEEKIRLLDDKVRFYDFAESLGLRLPERYPDADCIPENVRTVFKRAVSFGGHGVHIPRNAAALKNLIAHQSPGEGYLIEKFIEGQDYSLDVVRFNGTFVSGGYRCVCSQGNGPALQREILRTKDRILGMMKTCAKVILDKLDYNGVCGFDFRADNAGEIYLMECNPRFTGGIDSQIAAGFDIPWILYSCMNKK